MSRRSRKRKLETEEEIIIDWEQENIFPEEIKSEMESMWEIPQIFHFLYLAREALNIPHLSMYEMERMLLIPKASKQLANIMTSLLSFPMTKAKLRKIPPMPYEFWTNILAYKMKTWFKVYEAKHQDSVKVLETIGVEPEFWNVFPDAPLLNGKHFEELSFKQKVWLLKTVCDTVMHTRKTVQEEVAKQPWEDQFETLLGTDRYGARYIYFPQFLKSDLRIYRHCLDNTILSSVKPIKPKVDSDTGTENKVSIENKLIKRKPRYRRRKSRWSNGLPPKLKKRANKCNEKILNDCKCNSDSATGSLISEDTNLSSTSNNSNNNNNSINNIINNSNNNNSDSINLDTINMKRSRSSSKCSDISSASDKMRCKSTKSSGYDTNCSLSSIPGKRESQRMFKGFSNGNDKCNINIISGILDKLNSGSSKETGTEDITISSTDRKHRYFNAIDCNMANICKTDDEKLNEISATDIKVNDENSDNVIDDKETVQDCITSKSDDEKLNESKTDHKEDENFHTSDKITETRFIEKNVRLNEEEKLEKDLEESNEIYKMEDDTESEDSEDLSLSELRSLLQKEAMENDYYLGGNSEMKYNLRKLKIRKSENWRQETDDFSDMLQKLGVSKFQLVADSVNSLKELISTFSRKDSNATTDIDGDPECMPPCEVKLISTMTELLSSLENVEPVLRDSVKKARGRLQKEWTNFKEGSAEDQDSSGEGLSSNWWVLGSQGGPLSTSGDTTLQTVPQSTISPASNQDDSSRNKESSTRNEEGQDNHAEQNQTTGQECTDSKDKNMQNETHTKEADRDEDNNQESTRTEEKTKDDSTEKEQQSRRVLRTRGVSSYTEQLYSDDEIQENELEEWANLEALYTAPSTPVDPPTALCTAKIKHSDGRTNQKDSDQDWILPSSRKRKNKRPSANRRLKTFQQKLQNIKVDALQSAAESKVTSPLADKTEKDKPIIKEIQICRPNKTTDLVISNKNSTIENHEAVVESNPKDIVPSSTQSTCKVENVASVHSELDIKDEGPIYDSTPCHFGNTYAATFNPNYVMLKTNANTMNYYVMHPNAATIDSHNGLMQPAPVISHIIPPVQQSYYIQRSPNYIIQNPQPSFVPPQPLQPQGPQMITPQQVINHPGYVPYMVSPTQAQPGYVNADQQTVSQQTAQNPTNSVQCNSATQTRVTQNRYPVPRQRYSCPNGAVIRSSMPIRGNTSRNHNTRTTKNVQQQQQPQQQQPQQQPQQQQQQPQQQSQQQRNTPVKMQKTQKQSSPSENKGQKTTSLIMLSDSDDEIEMIITEKTSSETETEKSTSTSIKDNIQRAKPTITSDITITPMKSTIPPQIIQRMNQGGISITPIKPSPPIQNTNTQLVVVVNETGSHYALALPNGSKLILTPEQVAQIRASNGGKLIL